MRVRVDLDASRTTKSPSPSSNPRSPSPSSPSSSSSPSPSSSSPSPSSPSSSSSSTDASFSGIHRSAFSADAHAAAHARFPPSSSIASFDVSTGGAPGRCVGGGGGGATLPNIAACAACLTCGDRATSRSARDAAASREMLRGSMNDATISQHVVGMRFSGSRGGSSTRIARIPRVVAATSSSSSPPPPPPPPPRAASGHKSSSSSSSLRASRRATTLRTRWYGGSRSRSPPPPPPPTTTGDLGEKAAFDDVGSHDPPTPPPGETGIASSKPKLPPLCAFILKNTASGVSFSPRLFTPRAPRRLSAFPLVRDGVVEGDDDDVVDPQRRARRRGDPTAVIDAPEQAFELAPGVAGRRRPGGVSGMMSLMMTMFARDRALRRRRRRRRRRELLLLALASLALVVVPLLALELPSLVL